MANFYVDSNAAGAGTGADWANAFTTLGAAFTAGASGDTFYVAHNHASTTGSANTITGKGSAASPCRVLCVSSAGSVPPVAADLRTTATITTTGNSALTISGGVCLFYGITFNCGTGAVAARLVIGGTTDNRHRYVNCAFKKLGTTADSTAVTIGSGGRTQVVLENTTLELGAATDAIVIVGSFTWRGTASGYSGATIPTTGLFSLGSAGSDVFLEGVDLSALSNTIIRTPAGTTTLRVILKDCKLHASATIAPTPTGINPGVDVIRSDSGDTNYRSERYQYQGTMTTEIVTVRTGGASDGTTTISWEIVPTTNNDPDWPFQCYPISIWNDTVGAVTLTIEGTWAGVAVPTTADVWMDVEYLGTSGFPLGSFAYGGPTTILSAGVAHSASSETWGAGGTTKFKMAKTVTVAEKGPITVYVKYAHTTNTCWIDPKITVS